MTLQPARVLPRDEWERARPIFQQMGSDLPYPEAAAIVVREDETGEIRGLVTAQWVPHIEPVWIDPAWRGRLQWRELVGLAEDQFGGLPLYVFVPNAEIGRLASATGYAPTGWEAWMKRCPL